MTTKSKNNSTSPWWRSEKDSTTVSAADKIRAIREKLADNLDNPFDQTPREFLTLPNFN